MMQIPPFNPEMFRTTKEEIEERERELEEDATGLPPKEYLADWEQIDRPVRPAFSFRKWLKKIWPGKLDRTR